MDAKARDLLKMVHVNKRRLQTYTEFIKSYKQYKDEKKTLQN